jgi:hypothetical protein
MITCCHALDITTQAFGAHIDVILTSFTIKLMCACVTLKDGKLILVPKHSDL